MKLLKINIADKIARPQENYRLVCGNSDYVVEFSFDAEWQEHEVKTARFGFTQNGQYQYIDVVFTGNTCEDVPVFSNINAVEIGVFAGDLRTTTPCILGCDKSILCKGGTPAEPPENVYSQIVGLCEEARETAKDVEERADAGEFKGDPLKYEDLTEEQKADLLKDTAPKDHTHDVASYETDISLIDLVSETNGDNVVIKAKSVDLGTNGTAKFCVSGHIRFITKGEWGIHTPDIKVDGKSINRKEIGTDEDGYMLYAHEFDGDVAESIELISIVSYTFVEFETLCKIEEKDGFMSAEQAKKLANVPTTEEVNNLIAEAFGTVEAVFDEVHEYAESLGGDEA